MARREAVSRYRSSTLGAAWAVLTPLLMLAVYTFAFSAVFNARWPDQAGRLVVGGGSRMEFAIVLYAGLIVFNLFAETASRAPSLIIGNPNLVKKLIFPLEILPIVTLLGALFNVVIGVVLLVIFQLVAFGAVSPLVWLFPAVLVPIVLVCLGFGWFVSALTVYVRDVGQTIGLLVTGLMFLSPVFYPSSAVPEQWRWVARLNPLAFPIESARQVLVFGTWPDPGAFLANLLVGLVAAWFGFFWFQKTRRGFADVL